MASVITHNDLHRLIEKLSKATSLNQIGQQCATFCLLTGFDYYSYCATIPTVLIHPDLIQINSYPDEWRQIYRNKALIKIDPTLSYAESHHIPTTWDDLMLHNNDAHKYMRYATQCNINSGLSFPLHGNIGNTAVFNLASKRVSPLSQEMSNLALTFGTLFANHLHDAVLRLFEKGLLPIKKKHLSLKERECLFWVAEGKTTWEIAKILKISDRTVVYHLEKIITKLEVKNRQQAVAHGLMMNYISHRFDCELPQHNQNTLTKIAC